MERWVFTLVAGHPTSPIHHECHNHLFNNLSLSPVLPNHYLKLPSQQSMVASMLAGWGPGGGCSQRRSAIPLEVEILLRAGQRQD